MATQGKKDFRLSTYSKGSMVTMEYKDKMGNVAGARTYDLGEITDAFSSEFMQQLPETAQRMIQYGLIKVLQDRTSDLVPEVKDQGPEVRLQGFDAVWATLKTEGWNAKRGSSKSAGYRKTDLYEAIARLKGITAAEAAKAYRGMSEADQTALRNAEKVQGEISKIMEEKAQGSGVDLSDLV